MKIKIYLTLIVTTLTFTAQCFSMTFIEEQGAARRKLFNKRTSADYLQDINDHTNAINEVLSDAGRVSATPATQAQKETILKTVIAGALTDLTYDDTIGMLSPFDSMKNRKHKNPYANGADIKDKGESVKRHFTILHEMDTLARDLIAYVNYYKITAISAETVNLFGCTRLYDFSGLTKKTIANWFNDVLFGAADKPETHKKGLSVIQGAERDNEPKRICLHEYKAKYYEFAAREAEEIEVAKLFTYAPYHPDALDAANFLVEKQEAIDDIIRLANTIVRTTDNLQLANRSWDIILSNITKDAYDVEKGIKFLDSTFTSTVRRIASDPANKDSLRASIVMLTRGNKTDIETAKNKFFRISQNPDHAQWFELFDGLLYEESPLAQETFRTLLKGILADSEHTNYLFILRRMMQSNHPEHKTVATPIVLSIFRNESDKNWPDAVNLLLKQAEHSKIVISRLKEILTGGKHPHWDTAKHCLLRLKSENGSTLTTLEKIAQETDNPNIFNATRALINFNPGYENRVKSTCEAIIEIEGHEKATEAQDILNTMTVDGEDDMDHWGDY